MDDVERKIICLKERLKARESLVRRRQHLTERKLRQAHSLALMCLETQNFHPHEVIEALKISDRYVETLRGCIQMLGGSKLETTVTFPEGKVAMEKLSQ
ncbi:hypothetical protein V2K65_03270 [Pseudomonas alliivorans]|uniref:hypothetical protein n=1 Tax=Pseudomonas viridiflava TaxID=33069 RepID=UPI001C31D500|nr:hypothetical protein [Pseudomonas viridiflava]MEE4621823.1 hypothetical protein [Pseudomonas alliivorans]MEE4745947.1 hypothetical protein [Pseudomonas alliivorans]MEE4922595.1 hypothetical protein [Pseudomonas alliivorans]QXG47865.1 hypothetical protein KTT57_02010 [Pseudomonas viridiflava]